MEQISYPVLVVRAHPGTWVRDLASQYQEATGPGAALLALAEGRPVALPALLEGLADADRCTRQAGGEDTAQSLAEIAAMQRWAIRQGHWARLLRHIRTDVAAWLEVAGLTDLADLLREDPWPIRQLTELCERVSAIEAAAERRAIGELPQTVSMCAARDSARYGAGGARDGQDEALADIEAGLTEDLRRADEQAGYLRRAASRIAAWRLVAGLPPALIGDSQPVRAVLSDAYRTVLARRQPTGQATIHPSGAVTAVWDGQGEPVHLGCHRWAEPGRTAPTVLDEKGILAILRRAGWDVQGHSGSWPHDAASATTQMWLTPRLRSVDDDTRDARELMPA
jgi:hypothetical protein